MRTSQVAFFSQSVRKHPAAPYKKNAGASSIFHLICCLP
nr:MAG TPA: hypothetical protein [Caudoviricetes sp.]